ncbi:hypothetical protein F4802DRAFT_611283 [Xylaria palmicola]|nr:hypothetical protein F4802DRAFT_611283 [Xylaria palmicola]
MGINYSKWDNIDMDSEPEISLPSVPTPQAPTPSAPVIGSTPGSIQAVMVRCDVERKRFLPWSATMIRADHPVFSNFVPSVPGLIEIPLVLHRVGTQSINRADLDNQIATYLNIDLESGFAPRRVWMYCDYILDLFGEGGGTPTHSYNRQAFEEELRPRTGGENDPDD